MVRQLEDSTSPCVLFFDKVEYRTMLPLSWTLYAYILFKKEKTCSVFLLSVNLLAFYQERRSLIGYTTHCLFCCR